MAQCWGWHFCCFEIQLLMAYEAAVALESRQDFPAFADQYARQIIKLKQTIKASIGMLPRKMFSDTKEKDTYSQHCNSLAMPTDVIIRKDATALAQRMIVDAGMSKASVYFRYYLHQALNKKQD